MGTAGGFGAFTKGSGYIDDLISGAGKLQRLKNGVQQGFFQGNADEIFKNMARIYGAEIQQSGKELFFKAGQLRVGMHISTRGGEATIHINNAGNLFKIRIEP